MEKGCLVAFKPNTMGAMESNIMLFLEESIKIYIHIVCISGYVCVCVCVCVCVHVCTIDNLQWTMFDSWSPKNI